MSDKQELSRKVIREKTMQIIFQMDAADEFDYEKMTPMEEVLPALNQGQAITVLEAVRDHIADIDTAIENALDSNWKFGRIAKADLAILRNAVAEMLYVDDLPKAVAINEAVELAKEYGDDRSYAFVNSVLGKISE